MLAEKIASDPFAKVKEMISQMITKLLNEANEESEQKGFCDKELGENKITRTKLQDDIDTLTARNEENQAKITECQTQISTLTKEVLELRQAVTESTEMRNEEKKKNTATIEDSKAAQNGVKAATAVLKDFYA